MEQEIWKDIKGYEGLYQVSNLGRIKSLNYNHTNLSKIMKPTLHHSGYYIINLSNNACRKQHLIHCLVANTFIQNRTNFKSVPDEDRASINLDNLDINHKDENKLNNSVSNLEWCTRKYNLNYGTRNYRISKNGSKTVNQYDLNETFIKSWKSITEISKALNIPIGNLSLACNGKYKTSHGYIWRYAEK